MPKITNNELSKDLSYIKGKIEAGETFAKEHRAWEVEQINSIKTTIESQNGRLRKSEVSIGWLKGLSAVISLIIGWIFKKTF